METLQAARRPIEPGLSSSIRTGLTQGETLCWVLVASVSFHAAYYSAETAFLVVVYLFALVRLACAESWRRGFYAGLVVGLLIAVGRLDFFWHIFSVAAIALWIVYASWIGLFVVTARLCLKPQTRKWGMLLVPFVWCGLEYFRSELYYLRFSWLSPGLAFGIDPSYAPIALAGTFGTGFLLMIIAEASALKWMQSKGKALAVLMAGVAVLYGATRLPQKVIGSPPASLRIAAVQLEFPSESEVVTWLNQLVRRCPDADLLVLSEYTFPGRIPQKIREWCREHRRYLLIGGEDPLPNHQFYDTAFVISPSGEIVFHQAKSVPIQFFNDGLPALEQSIWQSPWGKIGICICYDLSYTRVTDRLVRMGAEMLIVPTMDVTDWGKRQHELHARMGPIRAAEYHLPVVRVASSGISQVIDSTGKVIASAPCPGQGAMISATLNFSKFTRLPPDRWLAPLSASLTGMWLLGVTTRHFILRRKC